MVHCIVCRKGNVYVPNEQILERKCSSPSPYPVKVTSHKKAAIEIQDHDSGYEI